MQYKVKEVRNGVKKLHWMLLDKKVSLYSRLLK